MYTAFIIFLISYLIIATEKFNRVTIVLVGAAAMVIVGTSANVVAVGLAKKAGIHISFWQFAKNGIPVTFLSVIMVVPYLLLRYL
jgi:Na+/H+ antiporter NhaD/arsenite permease-like protein